MQKIKIKSRTWTKDSYGLFDYETTTELNKQELSILSIDLLIFFNGDYYYFLLNGVSNDYFFSNEVCLLKGFWTISSYFN